MKHKAKAVSKKMWEAMKWTAKHTWNFITSEKCTRLLGNLFLTAKFIIIIIAML